MELNEKLQAARIQNMLTQEQVCQQIGVSRQTLSSWENGKTYPDIVSLINLCDLYHLSLDDLLGAGESDDYISFLDRAIAALKKRRKLYKIAELSILAALILGGAAVYLMMNKDDPNGYFPGGQSGLYTAYRTIVIPFSVLIVSLFVGVDTSWHRERWLLIPAVAILFTLTSVNVMHLPYYLMLSQEESFTENLTAVSILIPNLLTSAALSAGVTAAGLLIGTVYRRMVGAKSRRRNQPN